MKSHFMSKKYSSQTIVFDPAMQQRVFVFLIGMASDFDD